VFAGRLKHTEEVDALDALDALTGFEPRGRLGENPLRSRFLP
jgi:hypothetical protein